MLSAEERIESKTTFSIRILGITTELLRQG